MLSYPCLEALRLPTNVNKKHPRLSVNAYLFVHHISY